MIARLRNGSERNLLEILTNVINFWEQYLNSLGVIASARTFICSSNVYPRSRAESEENRHDIEIVQGQRYLECIRLQRFNYNTGTVEPIDLTGCQVRSRIYKPSYELDLWLTNDATGIEFKRTITLSENENEALSLLKTDAEQQAYVKSLPSAQEGLRLLAIEAGIANKIALPKQPSDSQQMSETANHKDAPDQNAVR